MYSFFWLVLFLVVYDSFMGVVSSLWHWFLAKFTFIIFGGSFCPFYGCFVLVLVLFIFLYGNCCSPLN